MTAPTKPRRFRESLDCGCAFVRWKDASGQWWRKPTMRCMKRDRETWHRDAPWDAVPIEKPKDVAT